MQYFQLSKQTLKQINPTRAEKTLEGGKKPNRTEGKHHHHYHRHHHRVSSISTQSINYKSQLQRERERKHS